MSQESLAPPGEAHPAGRILPANTDQPFPDDESDGRARGTWSSGSGMWRTEVVLEALRWLGDRSVPQILAALFGRR